MNVNIHLFCIKVSSEIEETASAEMADLVVCVNLHYCLPTICIRHTAGWVTGGVGSEACREGLLWLANLQGHLPRLPLLSSLSSHHITVRIQNLSFLRGLFVKLICSKEKEKMELVWLLHIQLWDLYCKQTAIHWEDKSNSIFTAFGWSADGEIISLKLSLPTFVINCDKDKLNDERYEKKDAPTDVWESFS